VVAVGKSGVTSTDFMYYLDEITKAGALPYRKIVDLRAVATPLSHADLRLIGTHVQTLATGKPIGPLAIVVASDAVAKLATVFEDAGGEHRPLQIFRDPSTARTWQRSRFELMPVWRDRRLMSGFRRQVPTSLERR